MYNTTICNGKQPTKTTNMKFNKIRYEFKKVLVIGCMVHLERVSSANTRCSAWAIFAMLATARHSEVWKYFTEIEGNRIKYIICQVKLSTTCTMRQHMLFKHEETFGNTGQQQPSVSAVFTTARCSCVPACGEKIIKLITLMITEEMLSLSFVEDDRLQEFTAFGARIHSAIRESNHCLGGENVQGDKWAVDGWPELSRKGWHNHQHLDYLNNWAVSIPVTYHCQVAAFIHNGARNIVLANQ